MSPSSPTIDRNDPPAMCVKIWCSECFTDLDHDGDNLYCPTCNSHWDPKGWDGDVAYLWYDDEGDEHFYEENSNARH